MTYAKTVAVAGLATFLAAAPAAAQELENKTTQATSGTTGKGSQGRASGANLSAGGSGPASETTMPEPEPHDGAPDQAQRPGTSPATKELFQH